ncbi:alcohol dehydrogenase catalytic domain-containing protein [Agromyces aurantiacus]|uniref:alcohol dehydrogenase n=1 Tax=Agromyces aurantiacus TaxID=165814 RepID=A0ABV9R189_9MICO|nr:zinc-dependent alcohol dehydrogenase [Agromyces aurantiacus]MBM7505907.1 propanol-preferring alcohol dehydrogenase [Agromyces aurantiacus]
MRAAVVTAFDQPVALEDRAVPEPGPGQVLVRLEACGLCHTDIHAMRGDWPVKPGLPFVPGHEGVGIVEKLGDGVTSRSVGERVAMPWLGHACGECRFCVSGRENLCEQQQNTGYSIDGGYAEYLVADAKFASPVPEGISALDAAPLTCAGVTTYAAVKNAHVVPGERVAVWGVGGLGHLAVQYARLVGAEVIGVDITQEKLDLARELGADHVVDASAGDPVAAIAELGGADVAIVLAVAPQVFDQAFTSLNRGGRMVLVSLPAEGTLTVPVFDTVLKGTTQKGRMSRHPHLLHAHDDGYGAPGRDSHAIMSLSMSSWATSP